MHGLQRDGCTATRLRRAVWPFLGRTDARTLAAVPQWAARCLGARVMAPLLSPPYPPIAATSGLMPMMFMTRVRL